MRARLAKAHQGGVRISLPSGLIYATLSDPEYCRRMEAAGLSAHLSPEALKQHTITFERDGCVYYILPAPDLEVWVTVRLRLEWMRELGSVAKVAQRIRQGVLGWPGGDRVGRIPIYEHRHWRHTTKPVWRKVTTSRLRRWFRSAPLYGEYRYTAHALAEYETRPNDPRRDVALKDVFPAPASALDLAEIERHLSTPRGVARDRDVARVYPGARRHALSAAFCRALEHDRAGHVKRQGAEAGNPARRDPRAPQEFAVCGAKLGAPYAPDGTYWYRRIACEAQGRHGAQFTAVLEDVAVAALCDAVDPTALERAVATWRVTRPTTDAGIAALRAQVEAAQVEADGSRRYAAKLLGRGDEAGADAADADYQRWSAEAAQLRSDLAAAERAAEGGAGPAEREVALVRRLAADLPALITAARAADDAVDRALCAARAARDLEACARLEGQEGQLRRVLDVLGVAVWVRVRPDGSADDAGMRGALVDGTTLDGAAPNGLPNNIPPSLTGGATAVPPCDAECEAGGPADAALLAAANGTPDPGAGGSCEVTVRFPNGVTRVRYADLEFVRATRAEQRWAYLRLARAPLAARGAVAEAVAAELEAAHPRAALASGAWTAARVRAAAITYATRLHGRDVDSVKAGDADCNTGDAQVLNGHDVPGSDVPSAPPNTATPGTWQSICALAQTLELAATEVRAAALREWLGSVWVGPPVARVPPAADAPYAVGRNDAGASWDAAGMGVTHLDAAHLDAALFIAPSSTQLERAFPEYARCCVAARRGWPCDDTVALPALMRELDLDDNAARYGAEHGAGVARDAAGRVYTRRSGFVDGPRDALAAVLRTRPDLADRPADEWVLQADAFRRLPGVRWITLMRHTKSVRVEAPGGARRTRVWVHLPPALEECLGRPSLANAAAAFTAAWHAARRVGAADAGTPFSPRAGAPAPESPRAERRDCSPDDAWVLSPAFCVSREAFLQSLGARGIGVGYTTYLAAVRAGHVHEIRAVPTSGGKTGPHTLVPPAVRGTSNKAVIRAWFAGVYADPSLW